MNPPGASAIIALPKEEQAAMEWISENTKETDRFVVITSRSWWLDPSSEWFPTLTDRVSLATVQGYEWLPKGQFHWQWMKYDDLQLCAYSDTNCLINWVEEYDSEFSHVYISRRRETSTLDFALSVSSEYHIIFQNDEAVILQRLSTE